MGESELCASVFYEYAVCDIPLLMKNLGGESKFASKSMGVIAKAMCRSIFEKAKRNGTAPHTPADFIEVVIRNDAPISLANAFLKPVRAEGAKDVMETSIAALREQADKYDKAYGDTKNPVKRLRLCLRDVETTVKPIEENKISSLDELVKAIETCLMEKFNDACPCTAA